MHNFENLNAFSILIKHVSEKSANEIIGVMQASNVLPIPGDRVIVHELYTPEADILVARAILIKYVSENSANEIIDEMKKRGVIRDPDKEAA